jgi:hypothetical protein
LHHAYHRASVIDHRHRQERSGSIAVRGVEGTRAGKIEPLGCVRVSQANRPARVDAMCDDRSVVRRASSVEQRWGLELDRWVSAAAGTDAQRVVHQQREGKRAPIILDQIHRAAVGARRAFGGDENAFEET